MSSDELYEKLKKEEPILCVEDIQGDVLLGFNKPFNVELIFNLKEKQKNDPINFYDPVKTWLSKFKITSTNDIIQHRKERRECQENLPTCLFQNISFGYKCIEKLLEGTTNQGSVKMFDQNSAFVLGAMKRGLILGQDVRNYDFPKCNDNNDILINLASDTVILPSDLEKIESNIKKDTNDLLILCETTCCFRGDKNSPLYGHEHFGFLDGLSQPEVRGTYRVKNSKKNCIDEKQSCENEKEELDFIVRRHLLASCNDQRYKDYSNPGFRLFDPGHFLLGYEINDINDGIMQNPSPETYRTIAQNYPSWCINASYVVYTKIEQDVPKFWETMIVETNNGQVPAEITHAIKTNAGHHAAKIMGRWWDGTPISCFKIQHSDQSYPPCYKAKTEPLHHRSGLFNGFQFDNPMKVWTLHNQNQTKIGPDLADYKADPFGKQCPFSAHIRKVNPRDEFTDIGSDVQTLRHRIIRRGNNYYTGNYETSRINDVFSPTEDEKKQKRGLALLVYNAEIESQFEFIQRHWANSDTRPRVEIGGSVNGTDRVIGIGKNGNMFTTPKGLGYFLLPSISAIRNILSSKTYIDDSKAKPSYPLDNVDSGCQQLRVIPQRNLHRPPANLNDFRLEKTALLWDWTVQTLFYNCIWSSNNITDQSQVPQFSRDMSGAGIAYRLPWSYDNITSIENAYNYPFDKCYLQFRDITQLHQMRDIYNKKINQDGNNENKNNEELKIVFQNIHWQAFPKRVLDLFSNSNVNPYQYVEILGWPSSDVKTRHYASSPLARQMDEYCEWFTYRNPVTKFITRIDITCESPEYFTFLFQNEPDTLLSLYQQYISPQVTIEDLQNSDGTYNIYNKWNSTEGAMHLNCPPNSLFAEVYIAAEACNFWQKIGSPGVNAISGKDLIESGDYGLATRASDPTIGYIVNNLIQSNYIVSVSNPVGLYLEDLNTTGWTNKDGVPFNENEIKNIVTYERGGVYKENNSMRNMHSRIRVEIPSSYGYSLGECFIGGKPIDWAGRLIDSSVTVFLRGAALSGEQFLLTDASKIVPPKNEWKVESKDKTIGPKPFFTSIIKAPDPDISLYIN